MPKIMSINGFREYDDDAKYLYRKSFKYTVTADQTNNFDEKFTEDVYISGGLYEVVGTPNDGDYLEWLIIDKDNILEAGENYIIKTCIEQEYINSEKKYNDCVSDSGIKLLAGLYFRVKYVSVDSANAPTVIIRYLMRRA